MGQSAKHEGLDVTRARRARSSVDTARRTHADVVRTSSNDLPGCPSRIHRQSTRTNDDDDDDDADATEDEHHHCCGCDDDEF